MATLKQRLHRKSESGSYDVVHLESDATVIKINSDDAETKTVADYLPKIQDTDDTPTDINPGQIIVGQTKVWFCGGDGETYELTSQGGGSWFPSYGKNFTYTGEYQIVPEGDSGDWKVKFLTSGTFTATDALLIDVFAVGGGGGGGTKDSYGGSGGGGGRTTTQSSVYLEKGKEYEIIIGSGGAIANNGGTTSGFNISALYGECGKSHGTVYYNTTECDGGNGGSGGGAYETSYTTGNSYGSATAGASDGNSAKNTEYDYGKGGTGQGSTTREFGESSGDLYSGGGGGGSERDTSTYSKGGSGGGGDYTYPGTDYLGGGGGGGAKGGSGILIIRNHRE